MESSWNLSESFLWESVVMLADYLEPKIAGLEFVKDVR